MENEPIKPKPKKATRGGRQTLFRVTFRNQITLIRIADSKANMILGINTLVLSVLMGIVSSKIIFTEPESIENFKLVIPVVSMMLTALLSAVFAIRSAKPRLIKPTLENDPMTKGKRSYLFFENIYNMPLLEYIDKMEKIIVSSKEVHENMIIDIYNQSKILHLKYRLLRISYVIFNYGLIISILLFLIFWLLIKNHSI